MAHKAAEEIVKELMENWKDKTVKNSPSQY